MAVRRHDYRRGPTRSPLGPALGAALLLAASAAGFLGYKIRSVARELVAPPFYRPQPLERVDATFKELAAGDGQDPGGVWEHRLVSRLDLWRLRRRQPAPGVVLLYSRNLATVEELSRAGYRILSARELILDPAIDLLDGRKYAILLDSAELSRARGGPRCMTMPLSRQSPGQA